MKVKCIRNKISELTNTDIRDWLKQRYLRLDDDIDVGFTKDREYVVYGIHFWDNHPFYFLCYEDNVEYPIPFYAGFFEVLDGKPSSYWRLFYTHSDDGTPTTSLVHEIWANDPTFYENLLEGNEQEVKLFQKCKKDMDDEADI